MESILSTLGLNLTNFLWHSANFLVLLVLLWLVLFKPVTNMLDERKRRIQDSLAHAEAVRRQSEQAEADRQVLLAETRRESEAIRNRADDQAKRILVDAEAHANARAQQIIEQANASIEAARQQMVADVRGQVANLVVGAVERVTRDALDGNSQRVLIQQFLANESANGALATGRRS